MHLEALGRQKLPKAAPPREDLALMEIDPRFPTVTPEQHHVLLDVKGALEAQAPVGVAPDPFQRERLRSRPG